MDENERELKAIHISNRNGLTLTELIGFHDTDTDKIYVLKDKYAQIRLQMFGSFRYLHVTEDDLEVYDMLTNLQRKGVILHVLN